MNSIAITLFVAASAAAQSRQVPITLEASNDTQTLQLEMTYHSQLRFGVPGTVSIESGSFTTDDARELYANEIIRQGPGAGLVLGGVAHKWLPDDPVLFFDEIGSCHTNGELPRYCKDGDVAAWQATGEVTSHWYGRNAQIDFGRGIVDYISFEAGGGRPFDEGIPDTTWSTQSQLTDLTITRFEMGEVPETSKPRVYLGAAKQLTDDTGNPGPLKFTVTDRKGNFQTVELEPEWSVETVVDLAGTLFTEETVSYEGRVEFSEGVGGGSADIRIWGDFRPHGSFNINSRYQDRDGGEMRNVGNSFRGEGRWQSKVDFQDYPEVDFVVFEGERDFRANQPLEIGPGIWTSSVSFSPAVAIELEAPTIGDSNLDGTFNSGDLVQVFIAGQYEDRRNNNSRWRTGDWNGDQDFDSSDLVAAFAEGTYESAAIPVPEPELTWWMILSGLLTVKGCRRGQRNGSKTRRPFC